MTNFDNRLLSCRCNLSVDIDFGIHQSNDTTMIYIVIDKTTTFTAVLANRALALSIVKKNNSSPQTWAKLKIKSGAQ